MEISYTIKSSIDPSLVFKAVGLVLLLFAALSQFTTINSEITAGMSVFYIMYVPMGIGRLLMSLVARSVKQLSERIEQIRYQIFLINWCIGIMVITGLIYTLFAIHSNEYKWSSLVLLILSFFSNFIPDPSKPKYVNQNLILKILLVASILGLSYGLFVRSFSPYPTSPGLDIFTHMYAIKNVISGSLLNIPLVYIPSLDFLIAMASLAFHSDLAGIFWAGSLLEFVLFSLSTYIFSLWISRKHHYAFLSTVIALSVTEAGKVSNLQFLFPASIVMTIFPIAFWAVDFLWRNLTRGFAILFSSIVIVGLTLLHLELGVVSFVIIALYMIVMHAVKRSNFILFGIRIATIAITIIISLLFFSLSTLQIGSYPYYEKLFGSNRIDITDLKIHDLNIWYTPIIIQSSLLGLIALSFFKDKKAVVIAFIGSFLLYVYFQQFGNIQRIMTLERPLLSFSAATTLFIIPVIISVLVSFFKSLRFTKLHLSKNFESGILDFFPFPTRKLKMGFFIYVFLIIILLFPVIMKPYEAYIGEYTSKGFPFANFTPDELNASKWIEKNTNPKYILYSDPFTVIEMRGLAFRKNLEQIGWNSTVANLVKESLTANNSSEAYSKIVSHAGKGIIIVISPRTSEWLSQPGIISSSTPPSEYFIMFPIKKFHDYKGFNNLFDDKYFHLLYRTGDVFVLAIR
jgi:hypothetical protein